MSACVLLIIFSVCLETRSDQFAQPLWIDERLCATSDSSNFQLLVQNSVHIISSGTDAQQNVTKFRRIRPVIWMSENTP